MKVAIRLDVSRQIGTGHFARCLTLANALSQSGAAVTFFCRFIPDGAQQRIAECGHSLHVLPQAETPPDTELAHGDWLGASQEEDAQAVIALLGEGRPDWLIVDHYAIGKNWHQRLRPYVGHILVVDDLCDRELDCDIVLDQNFRLADTHKYTTEVPSHCIRLLGPRYSLLAPDYGAEREKSKPRTDVRKLMIFFGGGDPDGELCIMSAKAALAVLPPEATVEVIFGGGDVMAAAAFEDLCSNYPNFALFGAQKTLAPFMAHADLSVGAVGATSWERMCLGVPTLGVSCADNQYPVAKDLDEAGFIRLIGVKESISQSDIEQAISDVINGGFLEEWSQACMTVCDGSGTSRVVETMIEMS